VETATWRKASYSGSQGGNCIEAATWRKASYSAHNGGCVAAGTGAGVVGVRDTQLGDESLVLEFSSVAWAQFTARVGGGGR
jgi:Domain of unknown function (DUF397)